MKVEVSFFIGGSIHKEIVFVERFEDAEKVAKARQPVGRMVNRKILMNWLVWLIGIEGIESGSNREHKIWKEDAQDLGEEESRCK